MTVEVVYEKSGEGILYIHRDTLEGHVLVRDTREHYRQVNYEKLRYQIIDMRLLDRLEMSTEQLREIAMIDREAAQKKRPDHKLAIVLASDMLYGIAKMWQNYVNDVSCNAQIFYSMEQARIWIERDAQAGVAQVGAKSVPQELLAK